MSRFRWAVPAFVALGIVIAGYGAFQGGGAAIERVPAGWAPSYEQALERARSEHKVVMADFYTDWCKVCKKLEQTTLADAEVQRALARVVPVKLDAEREGREQANRFGVDGYPTIVFLSAEGAEIGRIPGYLPPAAFLEELGDVVSRASAKS